MVDANTPGKSVKLGFHSRNSAISFTSCSCWITTRTTRATTHLIRQMSPRMNEENNKTRNKSETQTTRKTTYSVLMSKEAWLLLEASILLRPGMIGHCHVILNHPLKDRHKLPHSKRF